MALSGLSEVSRDGAGLDADGRGVAGDHLGVAPAARLLDGGGGRAAADQLGGQAPAAGVTGHAGETRGRGEGLEPAVDLAWRERDHAGGLGWRRGGPEGGECGGEALDQEPVILAGAVRVRLALPDPELVRLRRLGHVLPAEGGDLTPAQARAEGEGDQGGIDAPAGGGVGGALGAAARAARLGGPRHQAYGLIVGECGGLPGLGVRVLRVLAGDPGDHVPRLAGTRSASGTAWLFGSIIMIIAQDTSPSSPHRPAMRPRGRL